MDFDVRTVMRVEVGSAVDNLNTLSGASEKLSGKLKTASRDAQQMAGRVMKFAKQNEQALNDVGTAATVLGGSIVAVGAIAAKAGADFQSLQQTSRAALKTTTGSAEAAAAQMRKLNEYGAKSWVMRDVLIRAQQQMAGFGIETKKIIPYLEGLAEAVAASGGSNLQFEELASTMSKIHSAQKITAQDFIEFGNRGVDAASIIGEAMGKTGAQIRAEVTAGTLDADVALDALAEGMKTKFAGATDNLRNTFRGAMDNLSAAWRDFGAELVSPFIKTEGGGVGVTAVNALADALNKYRDLPGPLKATTTGVIGLGGAAAALGGTALLLAPRIADTVDAIKKLHAAASATKTYDQLATSLGNVGITSDRAKGALKNAGLAAGAAVGAFILLRGASEGLNKALGETSVSAGEMENKIVRLSQNKGLQDGLLSPDLWKDARVNIPGVTKDIESWGDALEQASKKSSQLGESFNAFFGHKSSALSQNIETIRQTDQALADLATNGNMSDAANGFREIAAQAQQANISHQDLFALFPSYKAHLVDVATEMKLATDETTLMKIATGEIKPPADDAAGALGGIGNSADDAASQLAEMRDSTQRAAEGFFDFSKSAKDSQLSLAQFIDDMEKQIQAQDEWADNLLKLRERGVSDDVLSFLVDLGAEGAFRVKQLADASDTELSRFTNNMDTAAGSAGDLAEALYGIPKIDLDADPSELKRQVDDAQAMLDDLEAQSPTPSADLKITLLKQAIKEATDKLNGLDSTEANPEVRVEDNDLLGQVEKYRRSLNKLDGLTATATFRLVTEGNIQRLPQGLVKNPKPAPPNYVQKKATGGEISGPGTGTSDSILIRASNGEHMWTAAEVNKMGGHGEMYRLRRAVMSGTLPAFAKGGAVLAAERRVRVAESGVSRAQSAKSRATSKTARADADARLQSAREELKTARERLAVAKKQAEADAKAAREAAERRQRVRDLQGELRVDVRRGSIRNQVTGGLSGAYSAVDRLFGLSKNTDLSKRARQLAGSRAGNFESSLAKLYKRADQITTKLDKAKAKAQELDGIQKQVTSGLLSDRKIDLGDYSRMSGGQWVTDGGVRGAQRRMAADVGAMTAFAGKLAKLQKQGLPGPLLQEIAAAGVHEGTTMADAFLGATRADQQSYIGTWKEYERQAGRIGDIVTGGFHKGGINAAQGVVRGLESQQKNVENQIANLARSIEATFKQVLGIRSPSRVMMEAGSDIADGAILGLASKHGEATAAALSFAQAMTPTLGALTVDTTDADMAQLAVTDMSATTLTALEQMRTATAAAQADMQANTATSQQAMQDATTLAQQSSTAVTSTAMQVMDQTTRDSLAARTTATRDNMTQMRDTTADRQESMRSTTATKYEQMRSKTASELATMLAGQRTATTTMRDEYATHLAVLKSDNSDTMGAISRTAVASFEGIRDGMNTQMKNARPELGGNMNRLIDVLGRFADSVNKAFGDVGVKLSKPAPLKYATGGVLPGYTPRRDVHKFYSPTAGELHMSGGEGILVPEATRAVGGERGIAAINRAARYGHTDDLAHLFQFARGGVMPDLSQRFADGGVWRNLWAITKAKFPNAVLTSSYRPGSITASGNLSHHARGNAIDVSPSMAIFDFWRDTYGPHLAELIFSPAGGRQIKNGKNYYYTGAVRSMHFNHVHIAAVRALSEAMAGAAMPGGLMGGGITHPFLDRANITAGTDLKKSYEQAARKLTSDLMAKHGKELGSNLLVRQLGTGIMQAASRGLVAKAGEYGKQAASMDSYMGGASAAGGVQRWAGLVTKALEHVGQPTDAATVQMVLRRLNQESSGNPRAINNWDSNARRGTPSKGLMQVIGPTFAAYRDSSLGNDIWDPYQNIVASMRYTLARYGSLAAGYNRRGGYMRGTHSAASGLQIVGENGIEVVDFGTGGGRVHNNGDSRRMLDQAFRLAQTPAGMSIDYDRLARAVVDNLPPSLVVHNDNAGLIEDRIAQKTVQRFSDAQALYGGGF